MMAAGVPIKKQVAGIAMGLIAENGKYEILTDIQGLEDHYGDMDFKVAGTREGVTALQMDNKAGGINREILTKALRQANKARVQLLDIMDEVISEPRSDVAEVAPKITTLQINPEKIRDVIGKGGAVIRSLVQTSGAKIDIDDNGVVSIAAVNNESAQIAIKLIQDIVREVEVGENYVGTVTRLMTFGAFVELLPGKEGLLHISEVSDHRIPKIESALNVGDKVLVTVKEIDDMKRVNLSRKRLLSMLDELSQDPKFEEQIEIEKQREEEYANLPKNEDGVRHENMGRSRKDFPSSDKNREARPARRFDRDKRR